MFKAELVCFLLDKSAGNEGFDFVPPAGSNSFGRYEIALLCLGMMHFHFGHPKLALEVSSLDIFILYMLNVSTFVGPQGFLSFYIILSSAKPLFLYFLDNINLVWLCLGFDGSSSRFSAGII